MKLYILWFAIVLSVGCEVRSKPDSLSPPLTAANASAASPTPLDRALLIPKGVLKEIHFLESAEETLRDLEPSIIWLEFESHVEPPEKVEFSAEVKDSLSRHWRALINYRLAKLKSADVNNLAETAFQHSMAAGELMNQLQNEQLLFGGSRTKLSEDEVQSVIDLQAEQFRSQLTAIKEKFPEEFQERR